MVKQVLVDDLIIHQATRVLQLLAHWLFPQDS